MEVPGLWRSASGQIDSLFSFNKRIPGIERGDELSGGLSEPDEIESPSYEWLKSSRDARGPIFKWKQGEGMRAVGRAALSEATNPRIDGFGRVPVTTLEPS